MLIYAIMGTTLAWIIFGILWLISKHESDTAIKSFYKKIKSPEEEKNGFLAQNDWRKFVRILNNIAYLKYPPRVDFSILERRYFNGKPDPSLFYSVIVQIFKDIMTTYPDVQRIIVEIYEDVKDRRGYMHEVCTISFTSTMENLKTLNWPNLSPSEVMRNVNVLSEMNGICEPFSKKYIGK